VAAIAPVAGAMQLDAFAPARPVPVLHVHSVDDPRALYAGGLGPPFPLTRTRVEHRPVEAELARWARLAGCASEPQPTERRPADAEPGAPAAAQTATLLDYGPCTSGARVRLWKLTGVGHGWPGAPPVLPERLMGPETRILDAADEVWRFVRGFSLPGAPPLR
jgi:polyhydroxybutyrate depolymerase